MNTPTPRNGTYTTQDGLTLYYGDHPAAKALSPTPLLCLPGLTRNSRDFEELITLLSPDYRIISTDLRGRGHSAYDPDPRNYHPAQYVQDIWCLLHQLAIERVVIIGTSLGGLMAMLMAQQRRPAVAAVVLNDVGPQLHLPALARVIAVAGSLPVVSEWSGAIAALRNANGHAYPNYIDAQWLRFAQKMYSPNPNGTLVPRLDPKVGRAAQRGLSGLRQDPWEVFGALQRIPTLLVHGALSRILLPEGVEAMRIAKADLKVVSVPRRGHAPNLDEPEAIDAIRTFLRSHY